MSDSLEIGTGFLISLLAEFGADFCSHGNNWNKKCNKSWTRKCSDLLTCLLQVRQRCAAESSRAAARHEREVHRLREELDRCRAELRDEQERRGGSLDAAERARLLQKVADAGAAKRRAEEAVRSAVDADRQKAAEIRRLHEDCRVEVARVSKEANVEIRRLVSTFRRPNYVAASKEY